MNNLLEFLQHTFGSPTQGESCEWNHFYLGARDRLGNVYPIPASARPDRSIGYAVRYRRPGASRRTRSLIAVRSSGAGL